MVPLQTRKACRHCQNCFSTTPGSGDRGALRRRLRARFLRAVRLFKLIEPGDRILVAFSGGKDSFTLLDSLLWLRKRRGNDFSLVAVHVDHGFAGDIGDRAARFLAGLGIEQRVERTAISRIIESKLKPGARACSLCSRLRRGALYRLAAELACNKIALGHHADDLVETLLLNLVFTGQIKSMPPLLRADDGRNLVIRPLCLVPEADTAAWAAMRGFQPMCCQCPACGARDNPQRRAMKQLLDEWEQCHPGSRRRLLAAHGRLDPASLLLDERGVV